MSRNFTDWEDTLMHYGVKGMQKGVRKDGQPSTYKPVYSPTATTKQAQTVLKAAPAKQVQTVSKATPAKQDKKAALPAVSSMGVTKSLGKYTGLNGGNSGNRKAVSKHHFQNVNVADYTINSTKKSKDTSSDMNPQYLIDKRRGRIKNTGK